MVSQSNGVYVGIDVGGTFTDLVFFEESTGQISVLKVPTSKRVEEAILDAMSQIRVSNTQVRIINHATTIATNALLTSTHLARTALITNKEFRDVLEIGRQRRPEIYNLNTKRPVPLVKRAFRFTIKGRILSDGSELEPISDSEVTRLAKKLQREKFDCVVVGLLNSYVNPLHERKVERLLRKEFLGEIVLSTEVNNEYKEYERFSTAVVNASLIPLVSRYLESFRAHLKDRGYTSPIYMMNSSGDACTISYASKFPVSIIESGPAAGVLACVNLAKTLLLERVATFDMGGTTAKAGMITKYEPDISYEFEAAGATHSGRSIKGSGYPVRHPFIDLAEISSGGGTIAWVDEGGSLRLGPRSAGADPGPAAYGKGGSEPTVTDANIILGRLSSKHLLSGKMKVYPDLALKAIKEKVADKIGMSAREAAQGIVRIANHKMARAISIVSVERGRDPRDYSLFAFGGAGPLHACDIAEEMGIKHIVVPEHPGLFSAYGLLTVDLARMFSTPVLSINLDLEVPFQKLKEKATKILREEGISTFSLQELVDLRYKGQSYEITLSRKPRVALRKLFDEKHKELYGYSSKDEVEAVNAKIRAVAPVPKIVRHTENLPEVNLPGSIKPSETREAWISGIEEQGTPVYAREELPPGASGSGPCVIEEYDSTTVINSCWSWKIDGYRDIDLTRLSEQS